MPIDPQSTQAAADRARMDALERKAETLYVQILALQARLAQLENAQLSQGITQQ
jgi:multidrug resistance efflux pump